MNLHTHTNFCDGEGKPIEFIKKALELKLPYLGFSAHAPLPFDCDWALPKGMLSDYCYTINELQSKFSKKISIYHGFEIDFLDGIGFPSLTLPYVNSAQVFICSIHFLNINFENRDARPRFIEIDGDYSQFMLALEAHNYSLKKLLQNFLQSTEQMLKSPVTVGAIKIIGHVDKIVLNAQKLPDFERLSDWFYSALVELIIKHNQHFHFIEINTRAIYKKGMSQPYPGFMVLESLHENQIPMMLNSDAHHPSEIIAGYKELSEKLTSLTNIQLNYLQL